jgi:hypothetical protein
MFASADSSLCSHHSRQEVVRHRRQDQATAKSLLADLDDFSTPDTVVRFLSNILREVAHKRVDRRDAATMVYVAQLLINSQSALGRFVDLDAKLQTDTSFTQVLVPEHTSPPTGPSRN